jgi:hypothetical protein
MRPKEAKESNQIFIFLKEEYLNKKALKKREFYLN